MPDLPYTDADLRAEAARQLRAAVDPESMDMDVVADMEGHKIPSRGDHQWDRLDEDDFDDAAHTVSELVEDAVDVSDWSVRLGANTLTATTTVAWGHNDGWDLAVQIAHRPGIKPDLRDAFVAAVRDAVSGVFADRGLTQTEQPPTCSSTQPMETCDRGTPALRRL